MHRVYLHSDEIKNLQSKLRQEKSKFLQLQTPKENINIINTSISNT